LAVTCIDPHSVLNGLTTTSGGCDTGQDFSDQAESWDFSWHLQLAIQSREQGLLILIHSERGLGMSDRLGRLAPLTGVLFAVIAVVMGIAALIPPAFFPMLIVFVIWSVIVSILMYRRGDAAADTPTAAVAPAL
jgi:hypothetical protein